MLKRTRQGNKETGRQGDRETGREGDRADAYPCLPVSLSPCLPVSLSPCLLVSLSPCLLAFAIGCADNNTRRGALPPPSTDPLVGGSVLAAPTPLPAAAGQPPVPPGATSSAVPPVPVNSSSTLSNAALVSGGLPKPLDGDHQLHIGAAPSAGATLRPPEAVPTVPAVPVARTPTASASPARASTQEQVQSLLDTHNLQWQQLGMVRETGEWKFSCAIALPQNPNVSRTYEGRAKTSLGAMQAVLDQIDKDAAPTQP